MHSLPHLSWWQLHPCSGPKPQNHVLLPSFLECRIQSCNKSCWLYLQDVSKTLTLTYTSTATILVPDVIIFHLDYCNNPPIGLPCYCSSSSMVCSQNRGQILSNSKSADAIPLLKFLAWCPISLKVKSKLLQQPTIIFPPLLTPWPHICSFPCCSPPPNHTGSFVWSLTDILLPHRSLCLDPFPSAIHMANIFSIRSLLNYHLLSDAFLNMLFKIANFPHSTPSLCFCLITF